MKKVLTVFILFLSFLPIPSQSSMRVSNLMNHANQGMQVTSNKNIIQILEMLFPTFYGLVKKAGFVATIENAKGITIFAPTEDAFARFIDFISPEAYTEIINNSKKLQDLLMLYIVPSRAMSLDLMKMGTIQPYHGKAFNVQIKNGKINIGKQDQPSATVVHADIIGTNGIIHGIDTVMLP